MPTQLISLYWPGARTTANNDGWGWYICMVEILFLMAVLIHVSELAIIILGIWEVLIAAIILISYRDSATPYVHLIATRSNCLVEPMLFFSGTHHRIRWLLSLEHYIVERLWWVLFVVMKLKSCLSGGFIGIHIYIIVKWPLQGSVNVATILRESIVNVLVVGLRLHQLLSLWFFLELSTSVCILGNGLYGSEIFGSDDRCYRVGLIADLRLHTMQVFFLAVRRLTSLRLVERLSTGSLMNVYLELASKMHRLLALSVIVRGLNYSITLRGRKVLLSAFFDDLNFYGGIRSVRHLWGPTSESTFYIFVFLIS